MITMFEWLKYNRPDVTHLKGPMSDGSYTWDTSLPNQAEIQNLISTFDPNTTLTDQTSPRILSYLLPNISVDDFRSIDHNTMLKTTLRSEETYGETSSDRGLLLTKTYFGDNNEKVFKIDYRYNRNAYGQYTAQGLTLSWYMDNDQLHPSVKDKGDEALSTKRSKEIVKNRRKTVVEMLENNIEAMLIGTGGGTSALDLGRSLMDELAAYISKFEKSGKPEAIINYLAAEGSNTSSPFYGLINSPVAENVTVLMYVTDFLDFT